MEKFKLIGVRIYQKQVWKGTTYFEIGKLKVAIDYAREIGSANYSYNFICCDEYGNYICDL